MSARERVPGRRIEGRIAGLYRTHGTGLETEAVDELALGFDAIAGDRHGGLTRRSGGREPWYPKGTEIRNERQLSLLSVEELAFVAERLAIPRLLPGWIGGNLLIDGIADFSWLPARTLLFFEGGVTLKVDGDNGPCRISGRALARKFDGRGDLEFGFVTAARHRRGLVAWVEKPGLIRTGETFKAHIPEQWIY